jgi:Domain of unknown function (DUF4276)
MEGGGDSKEGKARLRQGMAEFVRKVVAQKKPGWKIVPCGSRNDAHDAFRNANRTSPESFNVLLVDSKEAVAQAQSPRNHLQQRDRWDLKGVNEDSIHLMIQIMETWIIADPDTVAAYYKQHFLKNALPRDQNIEGVGKGQIYGALHHATMKTQKKEYRKIRDAAALLEAIDPVIVRRRCPSCDRLFATLERAINSP